MIHRLVDGIESSHRVYVEVRVGSLYHLVLAAGAVAKSPYDTMHTVQDVQGQLEAL